MAARVKKKLMGYDPLAWMGQETENPVMEDVAAADESVQEQLGVVTDPIDSKGSDSLSESVSDQEILDAEGSEVEMNTIADLQEERVSDEAAIEDVVEASVNLDAALTIQHVVKLHEKLKKSYSAYNAIEINASQVSSIDTAVLQLLVALKKDAGKQQKKVSFIEPSRRFIESAELLGLLEILEINA